MANIMNDHIALIPIPQISSVTTKPSQPIDQNPAAVYLTRLAPGSRRTMRTALDVMAGLLTNGRDKALSLAWADVRYQHAQAIRAKLAASYAPTTANKMLAALRGVLREAHRLGLMSTDDYQRAADLESVRGERLPHGRALNSGELRALFADCASDRTPAGGRDAALLAVLYGAGLRRSEAAALDFRDYNAETGALTVRAGKGNKARIVYAAGGTQRAIDAWLKIRGLEDGALFHPVNKGGQIECRRMSAQAVWLAAQKRANRAGISHFSPHDLRRSFITDLLDTGADISTVQKLAGHSQVTTTQRYDRRGEVAKQKVAARLHVPYEPESF